MSRKISLLHPVPKKVSYNVILLSMVMWLDTCSLYTHAIKHLLVKLKDGISEYRSSIKRDWFLEASHPVMYFCFIGILGLTEA